MKKKKNTGKPDNIHDDDAFEMPKRPVGRPRLEIDPEEVFRLATLDCTYEEIASFFSCDKGTISRNFSTEVKKGREYGKISLRRDARKLAKTNAAVCIFLLKNRLGMRDHQTMENEKPKSFLPEKMTIEDLRRIDEIVSKYEREVK